MLFLLDPFSLCRTHMSNNTLGFLPTESDGNVRGNYGLLDLIAALHWIQDNIGEFRCYFVFLLRFLLIFDLYK